MVVSEELLILASCLLRPMSRNSVLEEFSVTVLEDLQSSRKRFDLELCKGDLWRNLSE